MIGAGQSDIFWFLHGLHGAVAQLGEHLNGIEGVRGSNPLSSTNRSMRYRPHPPPKWCNLIDLSYVCIIWIRLPQVSSKTAIVTGPISVGSIVKVTPSDFSFSYSARMSVTPKDAAGMPWANIPF